MHIILINKVTDDGRGKGRRKGGDVVGKGGGCGEGGRGSRGRGCGEEGRGGRGGWGGGMGMDMRVCYCGGEGGGGTVLRQVERSNTW